VYRRSAVLDCGGLDEKFFCYCDDSDLGLALLIAGHRCVYVPAAVVLHAYSGSAGAYSELKAYLVERNRVWLVVKNFPTGMMLMSVSSRSHATLHSFWVDSCAAALIHSSREVIPACLRRGLLLGHTGTLSSAFRSCGRGENRSGRGPRCLAASCAVCWADSA
jgi:GT2 family glycosyltransferase